MPEDRHMPPTAPSALERAFREVWQLITLGFPITISLAAATLIEVVDTIMIAPLGTEALAAASITGSVILVFFSALYGLVSVGGVLVAKAFGAGDRPAAVSALRAALVVAVAGGTLGAVLMLAARLLLPYIGQPAEVLEVITPYWITMSLLLIPFAAFYAMKGLYDATDRAWLGVGFAFLAVLVNIPANWLLIHGVGSWQGLGLLGAGLASLLAESISLLLAILYWRLAPSMADYRTSAQVKLRDILLQIKEGGALALGYAGEGGAFAVAGLMLGWFGAQALAANQIVSSVSSVLYMLPLGMSTAVSIRVSQAIGGESQHRLRPIGFAAFGIVAFWMALVMALLLTFGGDIATALSENVEVAALATSMFIIFATMQIADGVQAAALGALRGMLDNRWPVLVTLVCYWVLALPFAWVIAGPLGFGPNGIWVGYAAGLALAAILLVRRFLQRTA